MASWPLTPPMCGYCPTPTTMLAAEYTFGIQRAYYCPKCRNSQMFVPAPK